MRRSRASALSSSLLGSKLETSSDVLGEKHAPERKHGRVLDRSATKDHQARDLSAHIDHRAAVFPIIRR